MQPKLPIVNVCTTPTSAMNRAGSGVKDPNADHRLEFFDPKVRPVSVYWDAEALLTAPASLALNASVSVYWRAVTNLGAADMNPLVEGDRSQAFRLAERALPRVTDPEDAAARIDMCAAAFLHNRDQDDGGTSNTRIWDDARRVCVCDGALQSLSAYRPGRGQRCAHAARHAQARLSRSAEMVTDRRRES